MTRSELIEFGRCPRRWKLGYRDEEETKAMSWGSLLDCLVTGNFLESYAVAPATYPAKQTKAEEKAGIPPEEKAWTWAAQFCKDWRDAQYAAGKEVVTYDIAQTAFAAFDRLQEDRLILDFISRSRKQVLVEVEYEDPDTGLVIPIACLIDLQPDPDDSEYGTAIGDLKTCKDASKATWAKEVFYRGYAEQGAMYLDARNAATDANYTQFFHVLCENVAPFETGRRMLDPEFLQIGRARYMRALVDYCYALKNNAFDGYDDKFDIRGKNIGGWSTTSPLPWMIGEPE